MQGITVHRFESTGEAYDRSQTGYDAEIECDSLDPSRNDWPELTEVRDGDLLIIWNEQEKVVGVMIEAWPTAFTADCGSLHELDPKIGWDELDGGKYAASAAAADRVVDILLWGKQRLVPQTS